MTGGGGMGHPLATLHPVAPPLCALFWATKAVKIADYNRGFPSHNCLLLLQLFPPVRFILLSLCSSLLFSSFFSSDTFTLPFGHLSPLWPFSPRPPVATPVTRDTATFSFLARLSFHFAASSSASSCLYFYSTRAKTFVFVRAFCMSFPSPPPFLRLIYSHAFPHSAYHNHSFSLLFPFRPSFGLFICCPLAPVCSFILFLFVFLFVLFSVSLCFLFSTPSPRDSQIC